MKPVLLSGEKTCSINIALNSEEQNRSPFSQQTSFSDIYLASQKTALSCNWAPETTQSSNHLPFSSKSTNRPTYSKISIKLSGITSQLK